MIVFLINTPLNTDNTNIEDSIFKYFDIERPSEEWVFFNNQDVVGIPKFSFTSKIDGYYEVSFSLKILGNAIGV